MKAKASASRAPQWKRQDKPLHPAPCLSPVIYTNANRFLVSLTCTISTLKQMYEPVCSAFAQKKTKQKQKRIFLFTRTSAYYFTSSAYFTEGNRVKISISTRTVRISLCAFTYHLVATFVRLIALS